MLNRLRQNLGTLLLAFILALTVWIAAINQDDPLIERTLEDLIDISYTGLAEGKLIINQPARQGVISLRTTRSIWDELSPQEIHLIADLSGLDIGTHQIPINPVVDRQPVQVTAVEPATLVVSIEDSASKDLPVHVLKIGSPALSYIDEEPTADPTSASVVGPASAVARVVELRAPINLTNRQESLEELVSLDALDEDGREVQEVDVVPEAVRVQVQITQQPNYRLVSVIPKILGQAELEEAGYRVTEVTVTPALVTIYSSDPQAFEQLPGFVETVPLDLASAVEDVERRLQLDLPEGFSPVFFNQIVTVKVAIDPRLNSITISRAVEVQGVGINLYALPSPDAVSIILTGPAATLDALLPEEIIVVVDVLDLEPGTYQLTPQIFGLPPNLEASDPIPSTIQVTISSTPLAAENPNP
ncbi:MAG: hypothetical protein GTO14_14160 [Anaerolineales bacterium]|nr:hypothetical protein [Anaerolineales bacterium]